MKKNLHVFTLALVFIVTGMLLVGCSEKKYENSFNGVYSYVEDNAISNSVTFYEDWGYYNAWVETKGYIALGADCLTVSFFSFAYTDETKDKLDYFYSIFIDFDGSKYADYRFGETIHSLNKKYYYSNGIFSVGKYDGWDSNIILTPSKTNMTDQPISSFSLLTTVLRKYIHSKGFTLDSLGYYLYK